MIAMLTGTLAALEDGRCVIDVGGVGYLVHASTRTLAALAPPPSVARLLIETQVREDAIVLHGFADPAERDWFRLLTAVQGVGSKVALGILSALSPAGLAAAIQSGDRAMLTRAPGVGAKLAARLLTELRDRAPAGVTITGLPQALPAPAPGAEADALSALVNLGYRRPEAQAALARVLAREPEAPSVELLIRDGLKELAR